MKNYYKRNLPHFIVDGYAYFITARLANTMPKNVILKLKNRYNSNLDKISAIENKKEKATEYAKLKWSYFTEFDSYLDKSPENNWLKNNSIAQIVKDSLHHRDGTILELIAYTIMSNHVHLIIKPNFENIVSTSEFNKKYPLGGILASFKRYTAVECNKILNRRGSFWQHENYDHLIRNNEELKKIIKYVGVPSKKLILDSYGF